jgi:hypothetical protein
MNDWVMNDWVMNDWVVHECVVNDFEINYHLDRSTAWGKICYLARLDYLCTIQIS